MDKEKVIRQFLATALWTEELEADYDVDDFVPSAFDKAKQVLEAFLKRAPEDSLKTYLNYFQHDQEGQLGHDLWLSINGHGAGFFDHNLGGHEDKLQQACRDVRDVDKIVINQVWVSEAENVFIE